eukprot:7089422-Alexandrium_andersonii.AAC.1
MGHPSDKPSVRTARRGRASLDRGPTEGLKPFYDLLAGPWRQMSHPPHCTAKAGTVRPHKAEARARS